ncbi:hypothetical protein GQ602_006786 [Ophiocordyceps camponoti-floridani]|uniref:Nucleolar protein 16 n=1 Tax=Ophiocordyceps camponoti-floridani TaxID=2030778 RepID=A0A8H4Q1Z0_9HYPO|nr:hypothetical protein GQ602_006786 [Ophiocordyceps camponoti-floridani]
MGREIQKKKLRSKRQPVRPKKAPQASNPRGNTLIAQHWDKQQTPTQNYRRMGLVSRLKAPTGGSEKLPSSKVALAIAPLEQAIVSEAKVERDGKGNIVRVLPESESDSDSGRDDDEGVADDPDASQVVRDLIALAQNPAPKKARHQSHAEILWLQRLVARYGDDTGAMARDRKMNPMQQTAADLGRRIRKAQLTG